MGGIGGSRPEARQVQVSPERGGPCRCRAPSTASVSLLCWAGGVGPLGSEPWKGPFRTLSFGLGDAGGGDSCFEMWRIIKRGMSELRGKNTPGPPTQAECNAFSAGRHVSWGRGRLESPNEKQGPGRAGLLGAGGLGPLDLTLYPHSPEVSSPSSFE